MKVRVRDIARRAGVSPATVSNALNGRGGVGEDTLRRILALSRDMGYARERAQSSQRKCIRLVAYKRHGQVVMDTQFFAELIEGIERECHANGMELIITHIHMEKDQDHLERIDAILREPYAGILLLATELYPEDVERFQHISAPILVLDSLFHHMDLNTVVMNNYEAGYLGTQRLIRAGHTRIEMITSSEQFNNNNFRQRRSGYEAAMRETGLHMPGNSVWGVTPTLEGAYQDMRALLSQRKTAMPTAFFAGNDIMAVGCIRAMVEARLRIPEDISIIGMDDLAICQIVNPPLSTVRVLKGEIGIAAVRRLVELMHADAPMSIQKTQLGVVMVDRQSVKQLGAPG